MSVPTTATAPALFVTAKSSIDTGIRRTPAPRIGSDKLLLGGPELVIEHAGQEYHLRLTRNDKLILTK